MIKLYSNGTINTFQESTKKVNYIQMVQLIHSKREYQDEKLYLIVQLIHLNLEHQEKRLI